LDYLEDHPTDRNGLLMACEWDLMEWIMIYMYLEIPSCYVLLFRVRVQFQSLIVVLLGQFRHGIPVVFRPSFEAQDNVIKTKTI
jgi:hypothetical protein